MQCLSICVWWGEKRRLGERNFLHIFSPSWLTGRPWPELRTCGRNNQPIMRIKRCTSSAENVCGRGPLQRGSPIERRCTFEHPEPLKPLHSRPGKFLSRENSIVYGVGLFFVRIGRHGVCVIGVFTYVFLHQPRWQTTYRVQTTQVGDSFFCYLPV